MALVRSPSMLGVGGTVIAIERDKTTGQALVKWAVDNLLRGHKKSHCVIIHVINHSSHSNSHSHSQNSHASKGNHSAASIEAEMQQIFLPCLGYCARKGVTAKELIIHDIDVPSTIVDYIVKNEISNVVVGSSHRNAIMRKFKESDVPTRVLKSAPDFCSVYVISKGKPQTVKLATKRLEQTAKQQANNTSGDSSNMSSSSGGGSFWTNSTESASTENRRSYGSDDFSLISGFQPPTSKSVFGSFSSLETSTTDIQTSDEVEAEMIALNVQLKQTMNIYNSTCDEAKAAKEKVNELHLKPASERSLEEAKSAEEAAAAFAELERKKTSVATEAAHIAERVAEIETQKRKLVEMRARVGAGAKYMRYSIKEIESATDHFNEKKKIGEGGYGPVYKGFLDHTPVAIKVLRPDISQGLVQFQKEVDVLSTIRHPNMVLLVGACPEYGCLVYEYMENGSLEDRLFRKGNTPPIPWRARFTIAAEIATALLFLHQGKPEPLVHRDLKPANILLDCNYVSKISDVGLARLVPASVADATTQYHQTEAVGTFCYIDPEYQQTGLLGVKSDVYALGVVLLQILTSRPPIGLSFQVEEAIEQGTFGGVLDPLVTDWPVEEAMAFAKLGLQCCEMMRRDRPDLGSVVLPELNRLRDFAMTAGHDDES